MTLRVVCALCCSTRGSLGVLGCCMFLSGQLDQVSFWGVVQGTPWLVVAVAGRAGATCEHGWVGRLIVVAEVGRVGAYFLRCWCWTYFLRC